MSAGGSQRWRTGNPGFPLDLLSTVFYKSMQCQPVTVERPITRVEAVVSYESLLLT